MIGRRCIHRDLNMPGIILGLSKGKVRVKYDSLKYERLELVSKLKMRPKEGASK